MAREEREVPVLAGGRRVAEGEEREGGMYEEMGERRFIKLSVGWSECKQEECVQEGGVIFYDTCRHTGSTNQRSPEGVT